MKNKKILIRLFVVLFSVAFIVSSVVVPSSAFFLTNITKIDGANVTVYPDRHMDNIYGDDFDFVYITPLQANAPTSNGVTVETARQFAKDGTAPKWEEYARFQAFDDYLTSAYRQIVSIEFIVVYTGDPDGSTTTRFHVQADGNYFFPQDLAVYYEDGLRALYNPTTGLYSFSFMYNYWYFNCPAEEGYSLAAIVYHKENGMIHADSDKYVTRAEYNRVVKELQQCQAELAQAQIDYDLARQKYEETMQKYESASESLAHTRAELAQVQKEYEAAKDALFKLQKERDSLKAENEELENENLNLVEANGELQGTKDFLQSKVNDLRGDLENNNAVKSFFQGAYEAVHGFCQDIFGLSFGGVSVGAVVSVVFVMAIVFFLVKILRG